MSTKIAEQMPNDVNRVVAGKQEVHADPTDRKPGTIDAKWGDKPAPSLEQYSSGVLTEGNRDRAEMLREMFDELGTSSTADKALVNQNFATPEGQRRPPHSPLLQAKLGAAELRTMPTLREQVHGIMKR